MISHMKCKECGGEFDYAFVPMASITSFRLGRKRHFKCPLCGKAQAFEMTDIISKRHDSELLVDDRKSAIAVIMVVAIVVVLSLLARFHAL
jgi:rubredoxin